MHGYFEVSLPEPNVSSDFHEGDPTRFNESANHAGVDSEYFGGLLNGEEVLDLGVRR